VKRLLAEFVASAIVIFARFLTAARGLWTAGPPDLAPKVFFANHASNGDFVLLWSVLPHRLRRRTRPVAASDYWLKSPLRAFVGRDVFRAVLINRIPEDRTEDPVAQMLGALEAGSSLILFPEGKRNMGPDRLLPFKSGLYHLARQRPQTGLVPVWIANLNRALPKGEILPVPIICTVTFGAPLFIKEGEAKEDFLARAEAALRKLAETVERPPT
jgi:1-acyl-sn-glycerol-3-phosphate acyltransferase